MRWPRVNPKFVKANLSGHSNLGLLTAALLYVICLTGAVIMLERQMESWEQPNFPMTSSVSSEAVELFAENLSAKVEGEPTNIYITIPNAERAFLSGRAYNQDARTQTMIAHPDTSEVLVERSRPFTDFVYDLHVRLHIPTDVSQYGGKYLVGFLGALLFALIITGVLAHPRIFREAFTLRWGGSLRLQEVDLHNRLSVWALPFHILVTVTGALLGISTVFVIVFAFLFYDGDFRAAGMDIEPAYINEQTDPAPLPNFQTVLDANEERFPDDVATAISLSHGGMEGQRVTVFTRPKGQMVLQEERVYAGDGSFIESGGYADGAFGMQAIAYSVQLHFGQFGGLFIVFVYFFLGLALCAVICGGIKIWFVRNADRGKYYPKWEKAWAACVWGSAVAMVGAAVLSIFFQVEPIWSWLALLFVLLIGAIACPDGKTARRLLQYIFIACCWLAPVLQIARFGFEQDPNATLMNVVLVCSGGAVALGMHWIEPVQANAHSTNASSEGNQPSRETV